MVFKRYGEFCVILVVVLIINYIYIYISISNPENQNRHDVLRRTSDETLIVIVDQHQEGSNFQKQSSGSVLFGLQLYQKRDSSTCVFLLIL